MARARQHSEKSRFRVHRPEPAVLARSNPRDVVAHRPGFPARHGGGRNEHRHVRLSARGWKRAGNVAHGTVTLLATDQEHVLCKPTFVVCAPAGQPQRHAFLAEQRVAAVPRTHRPHRVLFGKVHDEAPVRAQIAKRVKAAREVGRIADVPQRHLAHARHDAHVQHHVTAVCNLHAHLRIRRSRDSHQERDDEHRPSLHGAPEQRSEPLVSLLRVHPVVGGAGVSPVDGADEGEVFGSGDVVRSAAVQVAAGHLRLVELNQLPARKTLRHQPVFLFLGPVAINHGVGCRQLSDFVHPLMNCRVHFE